MFVCICRILSDNDLNVAVKDVVKVGKTKEVIKD